MKVDGKDMRTIWLESRRRPRRHHRPDAAAASLRHAAARRRSTTPRTPSRSMQVRGAPLIGAAAAYGMCLALRADASDEALERAYAALLATRPTAINLKWALDEMMAAVRNRPRGERVAAALRRAAEIADEDVAINQAIGRHGLKLIEEIAARKNGAARQRAHPLQCRLAGDGRLGHRDGADLHGARQGHRRPCLGRRDAAAQPGRLAHRLGARPARRAAHRDPRQHRRPSDAARHGRPGDRRHRPRHRAGRRLQQDRHLSEGAGGARQRRAVLCGAAVADHRFHGQRRRSPKSRSSSAAPTKSRP